MLRFEHPEMLFLSGLIPLILMAHWYWMSSRRRRLRSFGDQELISKLMMGMSASRSHLKISILITAIAFLVLTAAGPQSGTKLQKITRKGVDLVIALDVSNSMLAEDIKPNRLSRAKLAISRLIDRLEGDRIGLVVFAGKAYVQLPLTSDYSAARLFLDQVSTTLVDAQGTAIGDAINTSIESFDKNSKRSRAIILISDGENHEDDGESVASEAHKDGIIVHCLGIGSREGVPIPEYRNGVLTGFKKNREGSTVMTHLDETQLRRVAAAANGKYILANDSKFGLDELFKEIKLMEVTEQESRNYADYVNHYQWFLIPALLLLVIELLLFDKRSGKMRLFAFLYPSKR